MNNKIDTIKNTFYRNRYGLLLKFLYVMIFVNLIFTVIFVYLSTHIPAAATFSTYEGKTAKIYAFEEPIVSLKALLDWASQAAVSVYNVDAVHYKEQLKEASSYFTPEGWRLFQNDFQPILDTVITKKLRVSAVATGAPIIVEEGPLLGRYAWKIRLPILVTYESASETRHEALNISMVIIRVPTTMTTKGIAIAQFYARGRAI